MATFENYNKQTAWWWFFQYLCLGDAISTYPQLSAKYDTFIIGLKEAEKEQEKKMLYGTNGTT